MNLVGNSCVASYITRDILNEKYKNPFCWCIMDFNSSYNLVKFWDDLNFENYKIVREIDGNFSVSIEEKIRVHYVHYIFDQKYKSPKIEGPDVRYDRIWEYIAEKYESRIRGIYEEEPTFIFASANNGMSRHHQFTLEEQKMLAQLNSKYKIIVSYKSNLKDPRLITIDQDMGFRDNGLEFANYIYKKAGF